jgi:hypothetical protein
MNTDLRTAGLVRLLVLVGWTVPELGPAMPDTRTYLRDVVALLQQRWPTNRKLAGGKGS